MAKEPYTVGNLVTLLSRYYRDNTLDVSSIHRRELAFERWGDKEGPSLRPVSFETISELNEFVANYPYAGVYSSVGYYLDPNEADMSKKDLRKTDLVFDIDMSMEGMNRRSFLTFVSAHTKKLIDEFLVRDFGIPREKILLDFSGNKGFHITIDGDEFRNLNQADRRQVVDYIMAVKVDKNTLFPASRTQMARSPPISGGWTRHARKLIDALLEIPTDNNITDVLLELGFPKVRVRRIGYLLQQPNVRRGLEAGNLNDLVRGDIKILWDLQNIVLRTHRRGLSNVLDRAVTTSTHRLFRVPGSNVSVWCRSIVTVFPSSISTSSSPS